MRVAEPITAVDLAILATILGSIVLFGSASVLAMGWAFRKNQFENFERGARSIFGPDEPIGETTDGVVDAKDEKTQASRGNLEASEG